MSRTITLTLLRDDVRFQADLIGATLRHTDAQLTRLLNQSIQEFREAISNEGNTHYLVPYSSTLTVGATSPYSFLSLDLSAVSPSIVRTYKFEVTVDNVVRKLNHRPFNDDNSWGGPATTGVPREWSHYQTAKIALHPPPDSAYGYTLWYLPVLADLSAAGDTFDGVAGWEAWIVWDVVCRLLIRDQQGQAFASAKLYRDDVWGRIKSQATRVSQAGGAVVGRDTLRGRIPDFLAAKQAVMAGGGPPASGSVTLDMMADMTGPAVIGRESGTGRPTVVGQTGIVQSLVPQFTISLPGLVPAAGGSGTTSFLRQDGTWATPAGGGGGGGSPGGPSGSIQFNGLSGFVGYTGFAVQGAPPSMTVRLPGSFRVTGGTVDVGSGTVRISASGIDFGGGHVANVATLLNFPTFAAGVPGLVPASDNGVTSFLRSDGNFAAPTGFVSVPTGLPNSSLAPMPSGTVKANLSGTSAPQDVLIATLLGLSPTFTSTVPGYVPPSGGGTTNFLRADGAFAVPPGGSSTPGGSVGEVQFNNGVGGFGGASGIRVVGSGMAFQFGPTAASAGTLRFRNDVGLIAWNRTDTGNVLGPYLDSLNDLLIAPPNGGFVSPDNTYIYAATGGVVGFRVGTDDKFTVSATYADFKNGDLLNAGAVGAQSLTLASGLANASLHPMGPGTVKGRISGTGAPQDVSIPTLLGLSPTFTSTAPGYVPPSGGGTTNFLRADGAFAAPPGGASSPGGPLGAVQFQGLDGAFFGGSGITITGSGGVNPDETSNHNFAALNFGAPGSVGVASGAGAGFGSIRAAGHFSVYGVSPSGSALRAFALYPTGLASIGATGGAALQFGSVSNDRYHVVRNSVGTGGRFDWAIGNATGVMGLSPSGLELSSLRAAVGELHVVAGIPNSELVAVPSGTVKGALSAGAPTDLLIPTLAAFIPTFTSSAVGLVPPSGGGTTNFLRADGIFAAPPAAGTPTGITLAQLNPISSPRLLGRYSTGSGIPEEIIPTLIATLLPHFSDTGRGMVPASAGGVANFLRADGIFAAPTGFFYTPTGLPNANLAAMPSGTVKANLSGTAAPADVAIPTLMAFFPTFTDTRVGLVPPSGGGTSNFLRADGAFAVPPGGAASPGGGLGNFQFNNGVGFDGASGINVAASGAAIAFGPLAANAGDIRGGSGFSIQARNPSGIAQPLLGWTSASGLQRIGGSGLPRLEHAVASGGVQSFSFGGVTGTTALLTPTGLDLTGFHIKAKSIDVEHVNGLPANANALKRGANIFLASGLSLYLPRISPTGANRFIVPSGALGTNMSIILQPTGGKGGNVIRIERVDSSAGQIDVKTPTGTILYSMPSGTKHWADFMFTKPSGKAFELAGAADMF